MENWKAQAVVLAVNDKRSVQPGFMSLASDYVGNVTIPPNREIPQKGRSRNKYLYAYKAGCLFSQFTWAKERILMFGIARHHS